MLNTKSFICDCGSHNIIDTHYTPIGSEKETKLFFCRDCNSFLSRSKRIKKMNRKRSISCDANWGNIRHGKGARLKKNISFFYDVIPEASYSNILDIGSNRGHFINWLKNKYNPKRITAIESDSIVYKETKLPFGVKYINNRFENYEFSDNFSFIYNSHTLEHFENPYSMLKKCYKILRNDGYMFLEVPNSEIINKQDNLEEYFIDKHHYHFFSDGLKLKLKQIGFDIVKESINDQYNISFVVKKNKKSIPEITQENKNNIEDYLKKIKEYEFLLKKNRKKLKETCKKINDLCSRQKVAIWGCSRILDAALKYGELNNTNIEFVIDNNISKILKETNGLEVFSSSVLYERDIDVVIVMARSSKEEIIQSARSYGIRHVFGIEQF